MDRCETAYRRYLDGDESAVGEIMSELFYGLVFFVDRIVRDVHAAEDIALDAMSELFVRRRRYDFRVSLKTYVYMLGKSRALDYLKKHKRELAELDETVSDERASLEEKVLAGERKRAVSAAIGKLPGDMRAAVHLVYFEEMTYAEAAKVMKKSPKQVDNLLFRAKKELYSILGEEGRELI